MTDLNEIFAPLSAAMPELSLAEQRIAMALYRELIRGAPIRQAVSLAGMNNAARFDKVLGEIRESGTARAVARLPQVNS